MAPIMLHSPMACPLCQTELNAASVQVGERYHPQADDLTVCLHCASVLVFTDAESLRLLTDADLAAMSPEEYQCIEMMRQQAMYALARSRAAHAHLN